MVKFVKNFWKATCLYFSHYIHLSQSREKNTRMFFVDRLQSIDLADDMLLKYTTGIRGEQTFVSEMQRAKDRLPMLPFEVEELKMCIEPTMVS